MEAQHVRSNDWTIVKNGVWVVADSCLFFLNQVARRNYNCDCSSIKMLMQEKERMKDGKEKGWNEIWFIDGKDWRNEEKRVERELGKQLISSFVCSLCNSVNTSFACSWHFTSIVSCQLMMSSTEVMKYAKLKIPNKFQSWPLSQLYWEM